MGRIYPIAKSSQLHRIDFSLIPVGVILIEFSALATQLTKDSYTNLADLLLLRGIHTIFMLVLSNLLSRYFVAKKIVELKYGAIAFGALVHSFLGPILGVPLVSAERRIGIILLQGCFWFPAFLIVGSKRTEIFEQFRQYEQLIVVAAIFYTRSSLRSATKRWVNVFFLFAFVQGMIGYIQYLQGVPELLVATHLLGSTLVWIASWRIRLSVVRKPA